MPHLIGSWRALCGCLAAAAVVSLPIDAAQAQRRGYGNALGIIGDVIREIDRSTRPRYAPRPAPSPRARSQPPRQRPAANVADGEVRTGRSRQQVLASLSGPKPRSSGEVLRTLAVASSATALGAVALNSATRAADKEHDRDYRTQIKEIIDNFKQQQKLHGDKTAGNITVASIEQALSAAMKEANASAGRDTSLERFQSFVGENWTGERLRVMILTRVRADLGTIFEGNNRGLAPMEALEKMIQASTRATYRRVFETSELLAASRSVGRFVQQAYQTQKDPLESQLVEFSDGIVSAAASEALREYETKLRQDRDGNSFALRYRAQRIVFDCLSEQVAEITTSNGHTAPFAEVREKILQAARAEDATGRLGCKAWLARQFGAPTEPLTPQLPLPLRVVWVEGAPLDDASMYTRALSEF